jgi:hypothetical protein
MSTLLLSLTSCLKQEGGNFQSFVYEPVVIVAGDAEPLASSVVPGLSRFLIPGLAGRVSAGDCLLLSFKIDFDNQPNSSYYTATEIKSVALPPPILAEKADTSVVEGYGEPVVAAAVLASNYGAKALIGDLLFFVMEQKANKTYSYRMVYRPAPANLSPEYTPVISLYISAKLEADAPANTIDDNTYARVFDLSGLRTYLSGDLGLSNTQQSVKIYCRVEDNSEGEAVFQEFGSIDIRLAD